VNFFINIESKLSYENIAEILNSEACKYLSGIVVGRSDLTQSFGLDKKHTDTDEIFQIVQEILSEAKKHKLITTMGGNISVRSTQFIGSLYNSKLLDKIETRNVVFHLNKKNTVNLDKAIKHALRFESVWLRNKSSYYMYIGNKYLNRANTLEERL